MSAPWLLPRTKNRWQLGFWPANALSVHTLEKPFKTCHFCHLFWTSGAACRRECSLANTLQHHEFGPEVSSAGPAQNRVP